MSSLNDVKTALTGISDNVYHYEALNAEAPYIVWAEDNEYNSYSADNRKDGQTIEGTIDLYTKAENDPLMKAIPRALRNAGIVWEYSSTQYEEDTELIHVEWIFRVLESWQRE